MKMRHSITVLTSLLIFSCSSPENENDPTPVLQSTTEYTLTISSGTGGTVSTSGGTYEEGSTVNVTATPNSEYIFQNWSNGSTDNPLTVTVNENITLTANFIEIPPIQVYTNTISVSTENQNIEDILRTFYDPSGVFSYASGGSMYTFYPGVADWFPGQNGSTSSINEVSSHILKKEGDIWVYHQNDLDANFWGMRNFEILGLEVIMGDGNEIGVEPSDWKGDAYIGEIIENGDINWRKVNGQEEMGFFHGIGAGDLNNDGLTDVGVTPGIDHNGINIFLQNSDGSFIRNDEILNFDEGSTGIPFTLDFADLDNDGLDEIITADYGGGSIPDEDDHEIRIYKYDDSTNRFELHFQINEPNAYDWGLGATSIKVHDFNNDGINDIAVAREDTGESYETGRNGFEVWRGIGEAKFEKIFSKTLLFTQVQFREFSVFDANNDGYLDIILRPSHGDLFKYWGDNGPMITLNHVIWINDGSGQFDYYRDKELSFGVNMNIYNLFPYNYNDNLYFVGMWWDENESNPDIFTVDVKVNF